MAKPAFCTCNDTACVLNPANHDQGCVLCVEKCINANEIPSCFFCKVSADLFKQTDWSFKGFARLVNSTK